MASRIATRLPQALSDTQRSALFEFYAGRISAGEFSRRLGLIPDDEPERAPAPGFEHSAPAPSFAHTAPASASEHTAPSPVRTVAAPDAHADVPPPTHIRRRAGMSRWRPWQRAAVRPASHA